MSKVRKLHKSKAPFKPTTYLQWCRRLGLTIIDFHIEEWNDDEYKGMLTASPINAGTVSGILERIIAKWQTLLTNARQALDACFGFQTGDSPLQLTEYHEPRKNMTTDQLKLFYAILDTKNSWGKNEIRQVLLEVASGLRTKVWTKGNKMQGTKSNIK